MWTLFKFFTKISHPQVPLGRWCSVTNNHDILELKYQLKKDREKIFKNGLDPYELNKVEKAKEKIVSKFVLIDW
jgi:hypothetical protein